MRPSLRLAALGPIRTAEAIGRLSDEFSLTETERRELLESGRQTKVANRVYWTFVHLTKAELLKREA
jgi:restriction system protein